MFINLDDVVILNINSVDYGFILRRISKSEAINLLQNANLSEKVGHYKFFNFILKWIKKL